jgi:nitroreductase
MLAKTTQKGTPEMADILPSIESRRSFRALSPKPLPEEVVHRVLTAATLAPSCFNNQPWRFLVVQSPETLEKAREHLSGGNYWAASAPVLVLVITNAELDCRIPNGTREYAEFDTGLAVMNLLIQAQQEGLYAHPMAGFNAENMAEAFGIEAPYKLITAIAVGYPGDISRLNDKHARAEQSERQRKPLSEVVFFDTWNP